MVIATLLGFCFLPDSHFPAARADFTFGLRVDLGPTVNSSYTDGNPIIARNGLELYFYSYRPEGYGGNDVWVSIRATPDDPWGPPVNLGPTINTARLDCPASISPDGLVLFFIATADRPGGLGGYDTWMARRSSKGAAWSEPVNLGPSFNTPNKDELSCVSADGRWAYIGEWGQGDMWVAPIIPPLISTAPEKQTRLPSNKPPDQ